MKASAVFIHRPVATTLLMLALLLTGLLCGRLLPVASLPEIDYPTIRVLTRHPGASPAVVSATITAPLERQFGQMPGLAQMSSVSSAGVSVINLRFDLAVRLDVAQQDVQAAINAAAGLLPSDLPSPPIFNKINPADAPIVTLAVTSDTQPLTELNDIVENRILQRLSQIPGVGLVGLAGSQRPAIRIEVDPAALAGRGLSLEDVRTAMVAANVSLPKGSFDGTSRSLLLDSTDQIRDPADYRRLVLAWRQGAPVRLGDVANVREGAENSRLAAWADNTPGIVINVQRQPGANVIATVEQIRAALPGLRSSLPAAARLDLLIDRTQSIEASVRAVQWELVLAVVLVVGVIYLFLGSLSATFIPGVAVPLSLVGSLIFMWLAGFSVNTLTLMALTVATGFVVDDAIVVVENIARHVEEGLSPLQAALRGAGEIGFTILSLTVSLMAVLIPLLFMGGLIGRLFHEFAVTLAVAIGLSAVVSLTLTPMMSARLLSAGSSTHARAPLNALMERLSNAYALSLNRVLDRPKTTLLVFALTAMLTVLAYLAMPKGLLPTQDTGLLQITLDGPPAVSSARLRQLQGHVAERLMADAGVDHVVAFQGVDGVISTPNTARFLVRLKPVGQRDTLQQISSRLQHLSSDLEEISLSVLPVQDLTLDDRLTRTQYALTLSSPDIPELSGFHDRLLAAMRELPEMAKVSTDFQTDGQQAWLRVDRDAAARLGVSVAAIDSVIYSAFGQRAVSTVYTQANQYKVILEVPPAPAQPGLQRLRALHVPGSNGALVPIEAVLSVQERPAMLALSRLAQFPSATLSFDPADDVTLGEAVAAVQNVLDTLDKPSSLDLRFEGAAETFRGSVSQTAWLLLAAIITMYIVLGMLYESYVHPVTILSTLPSAGLGALLALWASGFALDMLAIIGLILLIGIVKKNAIMMIDFALEAQRTEGLGPRAAIEKACALRLRPILMTTLAALLGAVPLALGQGMGSELRQPLGVGLIGGLLLSQWLTLYSTPVVYLLLARWSDHRSAHRAVSGPVPDDSDAHNAGVESNPEPSAANRCDHD